MQCAEKECQEYLLIEFLVEELPPIDQKNIGENFLVGLSQELKGFFESNQGAFFVTPRRFGVLLANVINKEPSKTIMRKGPAVNNSFKDGKPTQALLGFLKSCQIENHQELEQNDDGYFYAKQTVLGKTLNEILPSAISNALKKMPIKKAMRWGDSNYQFIRPVHSLVIMYGDSVICQDSSILGLRPVNWTYGHRFMSQGKIILKNARDYFTQMKDVAYVIADFNQRREIIISELKKHADKLNPNLEEYDWLVNEVTGLVEFPVVLKGSFNVDFLKVPQECLILSMAKNQRYFALLDKKNKLTNQFLFVANLVSTNPQIVIDGNQKVLSARLSDAKFFYEVDCRHSLEFFAEKLNMVLYHNKLGTQVERSKRLQNIATAIAKTKTFVKSNLSPEVVSSVALLLKADLTTEMVGEFPELQGVMGRYYALHEGKSLEFAIALEEHYYPRYSGDRLPSNNLAIVMALSDKLETILGIWGIGLIPTGDKDPYALRRAALGIVRILRESKLNDLRVVELLEIAYQVFKEQGYTFNKIIIDEIYQFILKRFENYLLEFAPTNCVQSIVATNPQDFSYIDEKLLKALETFALDKNNSLLLNANKRIRNILDKNQNLIEEVTEIDTNLLVDRTEKVLYDLFKSKQYSANECAVKNDWPEYFAVLAEFNQPIEAFFNDVMVICEDSKLRMNRISLLSELSNFFNKWVELSFLN